MPGKAVGRHHAYPAVDAVLGAAARAAIEVLAQAQQLVLGIRMKEHREIDVAARAHSELERAQPLVDVGDARQLQPRKGQDHRQRIDVVDDDVAPAQRSLHRRRAAPAEGVIDDIALLRQPLDEIGRQLRLEAGAVRDLVYGARLALPAGPQLGFINGNVEGGGAARVRRGPLGAAAEIQDARGIARIQLEHVRGILLLKLRLRLRCSVRLVGEKYKSRFSDLHMAADRTPVRKEVQAPSPRLIEGGEAYASSGKSTTPHGNSLAAAGPVTNIPEKAS
jgi:hypothetical protein